MPRYRLTIEYDGTPFSGWQRQPDRPSVQQALEEAIAAMSGETVTTQAAGRTDAGVHALGQVAHFDLGKSWDPFRIREALNYHLRPQPVAIIAADAVDDSFEARFSARARHYEYRILNRRAPPVIERNHVWHLPMPLDADAMDHAAGLILGTHDFTTFRSAECQAKSPLRTLDAFAVRRELDHIVITASARSFLHHQVRSMVGSLKMVGEGKWSPAEFRAALDARDRRRCGAMAPSAGLYLTRVDY
ncbi:MAG: tRNA pseudouridine(38-40) synthase TruA [Alphaproteobacteria bacterium]|jgi:tRNA pseudouridine38-40 synthase|uniref:tRNA pseudouridine(38-40) synthase TruA n=1 Tax=Devosia sp. XGJD_8 TaxID=3391187 RepID=UPI001DA2F1E2|nr:tRNA pseudouridine(38-40) synthase TruA [Alphaproteobacteria bacterium]MBU1562999.1 tRNA pseudouridine(38-40) synthase TruA [Alphaproteobacteria bacterium]MBU2304194.1 tRNA pseudouridine(38-40) synthase TruA [Alphaproteobacteria bacterium]MBU2368194.1 tRNA pseudouridine(38-40) synthase TruA [Alphaproteobacteria bacterium]